MSTLLQPIVNLGNWAWGILAAAVAWAVGQEFAPAVMLTIKTLLLTVCIVAPLLGAVAYLTLWERKLIGWMQIRIGPNRVTFFGISWLGGLAAPVAHGLKLLVKEMIVPAWPSPDCPLGPVGGPGASYNPPPPPGHLRVYRSRLLARGFRSSV